MDEVFHGIVTLAALSLISLTTTSASAADAPPKRGEVARSTATASTATASTAGSASTTEAPTVDKEKEHENHYFVGATSVELAAIGGEELEGVFGGGSFLEFTVIENWLEIEAAVNVVKTTAGPVEIPVDVLLKKPFHVNTWLHPYVGLGPAVVLVAGKSKVDVGLATAAGSYFWLTQHVSLSAEIDNNVLAGDGKVLYEVGGKTGVVFGF